MAAQKAAVFSDGELSLIQLKKLASSSLETPSRYPAVAGHRLTELHVGLTTSNLDGNSDCATHSLSTFCF
jgi:hypothetical protein